jgi:hypothetical protein
VAHAPAAARRRFTVRTVQVSSATAAAAAQVISAICMISPAMWRMLPITLCNNT